MEKLAFTVPEFCLAYGVSRGRFHELEQAGLAPAVYRIGSKPYVSLTAAAEWQQRMETGAATNFKPLPAKHPGQRGRTRTTGASS